jgi:hypothetical protein
MFNIFFHWDEAYTQTKLAIFPEIWAQFHRTTANNEENHANRTRDHHRKRNQAVGTRRSSVA